MLLHNSVHKRKGGQLWQERMVTRTIETTLAHVICVDLDTMKADTRTFSVTHSDNEKHILKECQEQLSSTVAVHVENTTTTNTLYGMTELDFIKYAQVLPPRANTTED